MDIWWRREGQGEWNGIEALCQSMESYSLTLLVHIQSIILRRAVKCVHMRVHDFLRKVRHPKRMVLFRSEFERC